MSGKLFALFVFGFTISVSSFAHGSQICTADTGSDLNTVISQCFQTGAQSVSIVIQPNAIITQNGTVTFRSNINMRCESGATIKETQLADLFSLSGVSNVFIEGCIFDGTGVGRSAILIENGNNIHITRITAGGFPGNSDTPGTIITGLGWHNVEIDHSIFGFTNSTTPSCPTPPAATCGWFSGGGINNHGAIELLSQDGMSDHVTIDHNTCHGDASGSSCFKLEGGDNSAFETTLDFVDISHNQVITGSCTGSCLGIELFTSTEVNNSHLNDVGIEHFTIANNIVNCANPPSNSGFGISLGGDGASYGTVAGNVVTNCQTRGIEIAASFISVSGNTVSSSGPITWDANFTSHTNVVISDNVIVSPVCRGMHLIAAPPNFLDTGTISTNIIRAPFSSCTDGTPPSSPAAIRIQATGNIIFNVRLVENTFQEVPSGNTAVETNGSSQIQIENNRFVNNHGNGLVFGFNGGSGAAGFNFTIKNNYYNGEGTFLTNIGGTTTVTQEFSNIVNGTIE